MIRLLLDLDRISPVLSATKHLVLGVKRIAGLAFV
jgi:hypothetical protein